MSVRARIGAALASSALSLAIMRAGADAGSAPATVTLS